MPDEAEPPTPPESPDTEPDEMKLTASEQEHFRELLADTDLVARELAGLELRKAELMQVLQNRVLEQKRMQEKIARRLGIQDGQFNINIEKGTVVPVGGMMMRRTVPG
jgi:hypothetical protein